MRGKIIQYNGADGSGTLVVDGRQYPFVLAAWRGDSAPNVNKTVELTLDGGAINALTPVSDDVLIREKAAELGGRFGASLGRLRASIPASAGAASGGAANQPVPPSPDPSPAAASSNAAPGSGVTANAVLQRYGKASLIAYALFLIGTLMFNAVSMSVMGSEVGKSLFDIAGLMSQFGGGGGGIKFLLLIGYAGMFVPLVWRNRLAWLGLALPLVMLLWASFATLHAIDGAMGRLGGELSDLFHVGFGFYLSLLAALVLAALGLMRWLRAA